MAQQLSLSARPRVFEELIGQQKVTKELANYYEAHQDLPQCLMFQGPTGTGKTSAARLCSISLECTHSDVFGEPCRDCYRAYINPEKWHSEDVAFDITELSCAAHGLDELKRILAGHVYAPSHGAKYRIYILDELQAISSLKAQKFLLKIIEDAPASTKFFFCTTDPSEILPDIINRCVSYPFRNLKSTEIPQLVENLLLRRKSDLDAVVLADLLDERKIHAPRAIAQAVTKYLSGALPEDAVNIDQTGELDTLRYCRAVRKGNWDTIQKLLTDDDPDADQSRILRKAVANYLSTILLEETSIDLCRTASKGIARLTQMNKVDDSLIIAAVKAGLYDVTMLFS